MITGHREDVWGKDAHEFRPERFLRADGKTKDLGDWAMHYTFLGFSAGVRPCIGRHLALIEIKVALAMLLRDFELYPCFSDREYELRLPTQMNPNHDDHVPIGLKRRR